MLKSDFVHRLKIITVTNTNRGIVWHPLLSLCLTLYIWIMPHLVDSFIKPLVEKQPHPIFPLVFLHLLLYFFTPHLCSRETKIQKNLISSFFIFIFLFFTKTTWQVLAENRYMIDVKCICLYLWRKLDVHKTGLSNRQSGRWPPRTLRGPPKKKFDKHSPN